MLTRQLGHLELGTDSVGTRHEDRILVIARKEASREIECEQPRESIFPGQYTRTVRPLHQCRQSGHRFLIGFEVDARITVGYF